MEINPGPDIAGVVKCVCSVGTDEGDMLQCETAPVGSIAPVLGSPSPLHRHIHLSVLSGKEFSLAHLHPRSPSA